MEERAADWLAHNCSTGKASQHAHLWFCAVEGPWRKGQLTGCRIMVAREMLVSLLTFGFVRLRDHGGRGS
jgi:hypothetical protein